MSGDQAPFACDSCLRRAHLIARLAPRIAGLLDRFRRLAANTGLAVEGVYRLGLSDETKKANAALADGDRGAASIVQAKVFGSFDGVRLPGDARYYSAPAVAAPLAPRMCPGTSWARTSAPATIMAQRAHTFCSSRTLPGQ